MIRDLGERVEAILGQDDRAARLQQKYLGAPANGVRIVDHQDLHAMQRIAFRHFAPQRVASRQAEVARNATADWAQVCHVPEGLPRA